MYKLDFWLLVPNPKMWLPPAGAKVPTWMALVSAVLLGMRVSFVCVSDCLAPVGVRIRCWDGKCVQQDVVSIDGRSCAGMCSRVSGKCQPLNPVSDLNSLGAGHPI